MRRLAIEGKIIEQALAQLSGLDLGKFDIADDILEAIKAHGLAWKNYRRFSPASKRSRVAFIGRGTEPPY